MCFLELTDPTSGSLKINGVDLFSNETEKVKGVIGYISQDDLLDRRVDCLRKPYIITQSFVLRIMSEEEIDKRVMDTLSNLGLDQRKDLRVGSVLR